MTAGVWLLAALPFFTQTVETEWPDAAAAAAASARLELLGEGERFCFSGRWDDRNPRAPLLAKALAPTGFKSTFYVCGADTADYREALKTEVALGNSIGCHTLHHGFMYRMLPGKSFREIMLNRIQLEVDSQSPVVTLAMPYGLNAASSRAVGFDNTKVVGQAAHNAGLLGGAETHLQVAEKFGLSKFEWVGSMVFNANDQNPDRAKFAAGMLQGTNLVAKGTLPSGPHLTLGVHPWQDDAGMARLAEMVREAVAVPGTVLMNENEYVARYMQVVNGSVRKTKVEGNRVTFEIRRPSPFALGASVPVNLRLSDGRWLQVPAPATEVVPSRFERVDGALTVSEDEARFQLAYVNRSSEPLEAVTATLRLPPGYNPGTVSRALGTLAPGQEVSVEFVAEPPLEPLFREGALFAAVELNARGRRIWAPLEKTRSAAAGAVGCPRDCAAVWGPARLPQLPASVADWSRVEVRLTDGWKAADGADEGDAPWAVSAFGKGEGGKVRRAIGWTKAKPGEEQALALAFDLVVDTAKDGAEWDCIFAGGHIRDTNVRRFLNGEELREPKGPIMLRSGRNRLVILVSDLDAEMVSTVLAVRSLKTGANADFVSPLK